MAESNETPKGRWCLVGNIVEERRYGEGGEIRRGTRLFAPGARVYCLPAVCTRHGGDRLFAIGRHRKSGRFLGSVIRPEWVVERRAKMVYHPEVLRRIEEELAACRVVGIGDPWPDQAAVESYIAAADAWQAPRRPIAPPLILAESTTLRMPAGLFDLLTARGTIAADAPLMLVDGVLIWKPAPSPAIAECVERARRTLEAVLPENHHVRVEAPIWASIYDAPRPALAVVRGPVDLYLRSFPAPAVILLVVEFAPGGCSRSVYSRAGVPYLWVVNAEGRFVDEYGGPDEEVYQRESTVLEGDALPLFVGGESLGPIAVADLLP